MNMRPIIRLFNGAAGRIAGRSFLPFWSVILHQGRKSGRVYATPIAARRTRDGFAVPLAFGEQADWPRNVLAAGGGLIRWKGQDHRMVDPRVVNLAEGLAAFSPFEQFVLKLARVRGILLLRDEPTVVAGDGTEQSRAIDRSAA